MRERRERGERRERDEMRRVTHCESARRFATQLIATCVGVRPHAAAVAPTVCGVGEGERVRGLESEW